MPFLLKVEKMIIADIITNVMPFWQGKGLEYAFEAWFWTYMKMYVQNQALYVQNQAFFLFDIRDFYEYLCPNVLPYWQK